MYKLESSTRVFVDVETKVKPRFLNHEEPRTQLLTELEDGSFVNFVWKSFNIN